MAWTTEAIDRVEANSKTTGGNFVNIGQIDGEAKFRFVGEGIDGVQCWVADPDGGKDKPMRFEEQPAEDPAGLRKRESGSVYQGFMACFAWNYEAEKFQTMVITQKAIKDALIDHIRDEDFGDPTDPKTGYDFKIRREVTGPQPRDVKYHFKALAPKPLSKQVADAFDELSGDLTKLYDGEDPLAKD